MSKKLDKIQAEVGVVKNKLIGLEVQLGELTYNYDLQKSQIKGVMSVEFKGYKKLIAAGKRLAEKEQPKKPKLVGQEIKSK